MNKVIGSENLDTVARHRRCGSHSRIRKNHTHAGTRDLWVLQKLNKTITDKRLAYFLAVMLNTFNIADLITTYLGLSSGEFFELNPTIVYLFETSPALMAFFKLSVVMVFSMIIIKIDISKLSGAFAKGVYYGLILGAIISSLVLALTSLHNVLLLIRVANSNLALPMPLMFYNHIVTKCGTIKN